MNDLLFSVLIIGSIQLAILGGLFLLLLKPLRRHLSPKAISILILLIFAISAVPEPPIVKAIPFPIEPTPVFVESEPAQPPASPSEIAIAKTEKTLRSGLPIFIWIWLAGAVGLLTIILVQTMRERSRLLKTPTLIQPKLLETLESLRQQLKIRVPVTLYASEHITSPALYGWVHPRIFLPPRSEHTEDDPHMTTILAHECVHIRENDIFWQWVMTALTITFWFHPCAWLLMRQYLLTKEQSCDELVIKKLQIAPDSYASTLLAEARHASQPSALSTLPAQIGIAENANQLKSRINQIMTPITRRPYQIVLIIILAFGILTSGLFLETLRAEPDNGLTEAETEAIKEQSKKILAGIWNRDDINAGYQYASSYYRSQVSKKQYRQAMKNPQTAAISIKSRKLVDLSEFKGAHAIKGGKNAELLFRVEIEGSDIKLNENLYLILEDGKWLMTGHWIKP